MRTSNVILTAARIRRPRGAVAEALAIDARFGLTEAGAIARAEANAENAAASEARTFAERFARSEARFGVVIA